MSAIKAPSRGRPCRDFDQNRFVFRRGRKLIVCRLSFDLAGQQSLKIAAAPSASGPSTKALAQLAWPFWFFDTDEIDDVLDALYMVDLDMLEDLAKGDGVELTDKILLLHHDYKDEFVLVLEEGWLEVLVITINENKSLNYMSVLV